MSLFVEARSGWNAAARFTATAYLSAMASLICWASVSLLLGARPALIVSGSMAPSIRPGDLVVVSPLTAAAAKSVPNGRILIFRDPAADREIAHRLVGHTTDGKLLTKGDANAVTDPAPVKAGAVRGQARLVVPYIGRPFLWLRDGRTLLFAGWLSLTLAAAYVVSRPTSPPVVPGGRPRSRGPARSAG